MLHTTRWRPDTCACVFEYQWDDEQSDEEREHSLASVVHCCAEHSDDGQVLFEKVKQENIGKNEALGLVLENAEKLVEEYEDERGELKKRFKKGKEPTWEFDHERRLRLSIPDLTTKEIESVNSLLLTDTSIDVEVK